MAITYKKIAEIVGVSRATVDRVMHNRGHVDPDVERRVRQVADEHGFEPSHIGRALARAKNPVKIGVMVHLTRIPFFQQLLEGLSAAKNEISNLGGEVIIHEQASFDAKAQMEALDALVAQGVQGIAIAPAQDIKLRDRLNELSKKIPIVTFNTDIEELDRLCYVGIDNIKVGRTGAYLMDLLLRGQGGKVMVVSGYLTQQTNYRRVDGFLAECGLYYPEIEIAGLEMTYDDEQRAYEVTKDIIHKHPDLAGIFMVSSGQAGCCRAIEEAGLAGTIKLIVVDALPETEEYLRKGVIQFIVDQDPFSQGTLPPRILFDYLFSNKRPEGDILGSIDIKTRHSL